MNLRERKHRTCFILRTRYCKTGAHNLPMDACEVHNVNQQQQALKPLTTHFCAQAFGDKMYLFDKLLGR